MSQVRPLIRAELIAAIKRVLHDQTVDEDTVLFWGDKSAPMAISEMADRELYDWLEYTLTGLVPA